MVDNINNLNFGKTILKTQTPLFLYMAKEFMTSGTNVIFGFTIVNKYIYTQTNFYFSHFNKKNKGILETNIFLIHFYHT